MALLITFLLLCIVCMLKATYRTKFTWAYDPRGLEPLMAEGKHQVAGMASGAEGGAHIFHCKHKAERKLKMVSSFKCAEPISSDIFPLTKPHSLSLPKQ